MNTTDLVKKYKKELEEGSDKQNRFNVWAFLFGAIYFIFRESFWYFVLFMVLPFIASLPFVLFLRADIALGLGFLVAHTIAGFVAGSVSRKYRYGLFFENNTPMIVSNGLGTSLLQVRFNNVPEIVVVEFD